LGVEGEFTVVGEVLKEVEAVEENFGVLHAESFGDGVEGVFGHVDSRVYQVQDFLVEL